MSGGVIASERAIRASQEPYCDMVSVVFTFGPMRTVHRVKVPIECLNIEVAGREFAIPRLFPSKVLCEFGVSLPETDIPWVEGVKQFVKYLMPPHKNNKRVTTSPVVPLALVPAAILPLYFICKRMHMERLAGIICQEIEKLNCSQAVTVVQQIVKAGAEEISFLDILLDKLARELPNLRAQAFGGIEMASVILSVLQRASPSQDPISVVDWLYVVFPKFAETGAFTDKIEAILKMLKCDNVNSAYIAWCYSNFLSSIPGVELFSRFAGDFVLQKLETTFVLSAETVIWLLRNISREKNQRVMMQVVCRWLRMNDKVGKKELFVHAMENNLLNFQALDGGDLCVLLPFAYEYNIDCFLDIQRELKLNMRKWRIAVTTKTKELYTLPWQELIQTFVLTADPKPQEKASNLVSEMRLNFRPLDSLFYHWIILHEDDLNVEILAKYLSLPTTELCHQKKQYRRIVTIDVLNRLGEPAAALKATAIKEFSSFVDFSVVLKDLLRKKDRVLNEKTIEYLHENCKARPSLMVQFVQLIARLPLAYEPDMAVDWILPVNELSVGTCLDILSRAANPSITVRDNVLAITRLVLGSLSNDDLDRAISLFSFKDMFAGFGAFVFVSDEDMVLYYGLKRDEIDFTQDCPDFIRFPHISLRALSIVTGDARLQKQFQFPIDEKSVLASMPTIENFPIKWWCRFDIPPRVGTNWNLASTPPRNAYIYVFAQQTREMDDCIASTLNFLGLPTSTQVTDTVFEFAWTYVTNYTKFRTGYDVYIFYMPSDVPFDVDFWTLVHGMATCGESIPLVVSATAALKMQQFYRSTWEQIVGKSTQLTGYDVVGEDRYMQWNEPSPSLLPRKQDLFKDILSPSGKDTFYGSIPFSGGVGNEWHSQMEWKNGRIFAGSISGTSLSVFNFEILTPPKMVDPLDIWIRSKHVALCLLSLMCESIAGAEPVLTNMDMAQ